MTIVISFSEWLLDLQSWMNRHKRDETPSIHSRGRSGQTNPTTVPTIFKTRQSTIEVVPKQEHYTNYRQQAFMLLPAWERVVPMWNHINFALPLVWTICVKCHDKLCSYVHVSNVTVHVTCLATPCYHAGAHVILSSVFKSVILFTAEQAYQNVAVLPET